MMNHINKKKDEKGFTLIELMIVVAIIGILAAIAIPQFAAYRIKAFNSSAQSDLRNTKLAEEALFADYQSYGTSITGFTLANAAPPAVGAAIPAGAILPSGPGATTVAPPVPGGNAISAGPGAGGGTAAVAVGVSQGVGIEAVSLAVFPAATANMGAKHVQGDRSYGMDTDATALYFSAGRAADAAGTPLAAGSAALAVGLPGVVEYAVAPWAAM